MLLTLKTTGLALLLFLMTSLPAQAEGSQQPQVEPLDYALLSHVLAIDTLRAGNHDASGVDDYFFAVKMLGLLNNSEERNSAFEKRKKLEVDLGNFGDTKIDALSAWHADEKTHDVKELRVEGNAIRELLARTMTEFKVGEGDVAVMIEITMFERARKYLVLPDDHVVAKTSYFPISPTKFDTPFRTNISLSITDDKGTNVKLAVRYDKSITPTKPTLVPAAAAASAAAAPAPGTPPVK